jgi:hypothetical protein
LTHGRREASVPDLIYFLERNGFYRWSHPSPHRSLWRLVNWLRWILWSCSNSGQVDFRSKPRS